MNRSVRDSEWRRVRDEIDEAPGFLEVRYGRGDSR